MKSLATLIKLQKTYVDEQRVHLAKLQERLAYIEKEIVELELRMGREKLIAESSSEGRMTYGAFVKSAVKKARDLEKDRTGAAAAVEVALGKLTVLFEEQKRYEIAEEQRIAEEAQEELRRERITLDEIGGMTHQRKQK